jgi:hypothetical protein
MTVLPHLIEVGEMTESLYEPVFRYPLRGVCEGVLRLDG